MEKIIIKNFGPIEDAEIEIRKVLVLIGEQASGKSTIAKLVYFFKTIGEEFYQNFKWRADHEAYKIEKANIALPRQFPYFSTKFASVIKRFSDDYNVTLQEANPITFP